MNTKQKKALYESIMKSVAKTVKKSLNEISSQTLYNAAKKQSDMLDDDDYLSDHDDDYLLKAKKRIGKFKQYGDTVKNREEMDQEEQDLLDRAKAAREQKNLVNNIKNRYDQLFADMYNKIKSIWTNEKIKSECISIAYNNDLFELFYTPSSRGGIYHQSICDVIKQQAYNYCSSAELKAQIADKCDAIYDEELDIIIPKSIPAKEYENICLVYYGEQQDELSDIMPTDEEVGEFLISEFKDCMVLKSDGKFIKFGFDFEMPDGNSTDSVDAKIYKYFIDCSYDGEIDDYVSRYLNTCDDYIIIQQGNASEYSEYVGILCKNKRIANTICNNIGKYTGRHWEAPGPELIKKGIIWQYEEYN